MNRIKMGMNPTINGVKNKMRSNYQLSFCQEDTFTSQFSNKTYLQSLLELLNTTDDMNLQIKLFSALSACLMFSKYTNVDIIIRSRAVYNKIHNILKKGLPRKSTDALNFLSTLLYVNVEEDTTTRRTLALYARNMTRISGCLDAMTEMFTNCMMYHDTWKALCQCLAIACSDCERNQSYCRHLIPVCIQKCSQANIDIFLLLQSLILNNIQNIQLFLECNGTAIFTRELLHYDQSLQLLTTVVQCPAALPVLLRQTQTLDDLRDFVRLYGLYSQIGQKATIILKHIEWRSKGLERQIPRNIIKGKPQINVAENTSYVHNELDDTKTLMQNVLNEVFNYKQNELQQFKKPLSTVAVNSFIRGTSTTVSNSGNRETRTNTLIDKLRKNKLHCNIATDLSFSFLQNHCEDLSTNRNHLKNRAMNKSKACKVNRNETTMDNTKTQTLANLEKNLPDFSMTSCDQSPTLVGYTDFRPIFLSTPKHDEIFLDQTRSTTPRRPLNLTTQTQTTQQRSARVEKRIRKNVIRNGDSLRNRSLSSRFFSAINESCTTLMKSVANIFKKKEAPDTSKDTTNSRQSHLSHLHDSMSCSYSFLRYMKKRDAVLNKPILNKRNKENTEFSLETKLCETCDDTEVLKQKMTKDEHLKQTVNKLKLGINLYGCDFKKISRTMWPRESYMTPVVLYNLYRKLLLKEN